MQFILLLIAAVGASSYKTQVRNSLYNRIFSEFTIKINRWLISKGNYLTKHEHEDDSDMMKDWINQRKFARGLMALSVYELRTRNNELSSMYKLI